MVIKTEVVLGSFGCDKNLLYLRYGHGDKPAFFGISSIQIYQQFNRLPLYILVVFMGT